MEGVLLTVAPAATLPAISIIRADQTLKLYLRVAGYGYGLGKQSKREKRLPSTTAQNIWRNISLRKDANVKVR
jgi:hypothetical protein